MNMKPLLSSIHTLKILSYYLLSSAPKMIDLRNAINSIVIRIVEMVRGRSHETSAWRVKR